jgi:hypothetical protein
MTPNIPISNDTDLIRRIGIAFTTRPRIAWHAIFVAVRDGIVTLRGNVPTANDQRLVVSLTRHVAGVRKVDDELVVDETPFGDQHGAVEPPHRNFTNESQPKQAWIRLQKLPLVPESLDEILKRRVQS